MQCVLRHNLVARSQSKLALVLNTSWSVPIHRSRSHLRPFYVRLGNCQLPARRRLQRLPVRALDNPTVQAPDVKESQHRKGPEPPRQSKPSLFKILYNRTLRRLSSLKLAIAELALIATLSALGTFIEQNKPYEYYMQFYPDGPSKVLGFIDYKLIVALQWDHIYSAEYFLLLLGLLGASLLACSTTRQWPALRVAQRWYFQKSPSSFSKFGISEELPNARLGDLGRLLSQDGFQVFYKDGQLYGFKGLAGKLGPIGVHASMILVMLGVAVGAVGGFKGTAMIPEGGDFLLAQYLRPSSSLATPPPGAGAIMHVNSFDIDYRADGSVAQFKTDLSVRKFDGEDIYRKVISVNEPLRFGGVTMYQTDWSMAALALQVTDSQLQSPDGGPVAIPMASLEQSLGNRVWATFIPTGAEDPVSGKPLGVTVLAQDLKTVTLYDSKGQFAGVRRVDSGKPITVEGMEIVIKGIIASTGMELKVDPGVPIVYLGFAGMLLATLMSYGSHLQVWALQSGSTVHVGGASNRASALFEQELSRLLDQVPEVVTQEQLEGGGGELVEGCNAVASKEQ